MTESAEVYDDNWELWADMKIHGPASRWLRFLIDRGMSKLVPSEIRTWVDVGCGEGTNTVHFARSLPDCEVLGIDFSQTAITIANRINKKNNLNFRVDSESDALSKNFDVVSCLEVLEHVEDWQSLLGRLADAASKYLILSFPTGRMRPFEVNVGHLRNFKKGEVESFLGLKGFEPLKLQYAGFPFYSPFYRELCNLNNAASSKFTQGSYSLKQKLLANVFYVLFLCSTRKHWGDQFVGVFYRKEVGAL